MPKPPSQEHINQLFPSRPSCPAHNPHVFEMTLSYTSLIVPRPRLHITENQCQSWTISMHLLLTVLHIFLMVLAGRICMKITSSYLWWSFSLFSWPYIMFDKWWYCEEILDACHYWSLKVWGTGKAVKSKAILKGRPVRYIVLGYQGDHWQQAVIIHALQPTMSNFTKLCYLWLPIIFFIPFPN